MSDTNQEPKQSPSIEETMDKFFDGQDGVEQPQTEAPAETEQSESQESVTDTPKTEAPDDKDSFEGVDKGFANHPAWQKREQKLKETEAKLKELEQNNSKYSKLLDDPLIYKKYLESQGLSKEDVSHYMRERGFTESLGDQQKSDLAEDICKELGWDINKLDASQKAYLSDQVKFTQAIIQKSLGQTLESRLKPMERYLEEVQVSRKNEVEYEKVKEEAKKEFPDLDWEKDIEPALSRYLDKLDKEDPDKKIKLDMTTLYERGTRELLKEKKVSEARREERNVLKKNARPLLPRNPSQSNPNLKGKSAFETADKFLDELGVKD